LRKVSVLFYIVVLFSGLILMTGCPSVSVMRGPKITPKKKLKFQLQPNLIGAAAAVATPAGNVSGTIPGTLPVLDFALSYGINDFMDVQVHVNTLLYSGIGMGFQAVRGAADGLLDVALAFEVGGLFLSFSDPTSSGNSVGVSYLNVPLYGLFGLNLSKTVALHVAMGYQFSRGLASAGASVELVSHVLLGGVGIQFDVSKTVSLKPQLSFFYPLVAGGAFQFILWDASLGVNFTF